ncbi:suppressor of tumorigenicity 14 -like protein [Brachionus plicatilis]|uniref:Suppressor of tumorigenicity 14-like protein n=1 Tax=Brachionus plicatilis TaxID=10195 RepID=A0A3M7Q2W5_BRAPC|nr:suppressor of tumorigenicity 14 -like protein [Brachionus plicatilis]
MDSSSNKINPTPDFSNQKDSIDNKNRSENKKSKITVILIGAGVGICICCSIALIILLVIYGAFPCSVAYCDENAYCVNNPFFADCICNTGFGGNGYECDECGNFQLNEFSAIPLNIAVEPNSWPATADILFRYTSEIQSPTGTHLVFGFDNCGGTIINRKAILTSASCIKRTFITFVDRKFLSFPVETNKYHETIESMYSIYVAVVNQISFGVDIAPARYVKVEKIIKHENYDPETDDNDIAVIILEDRLELDDKVQISCLPSKEEDPNIFPERNQHAWGVGWGSSMFGGNGNFKPSRALQDLKKFQLNIYNNSMCSNITKFHIDNLNNDAFCAGEYNVVSGNGKTGYCHGDYGGSLYLRQNVSGVEKLVAIGILSYNEGCNAEHSPGIYTNVVKYIEWIRKNSYY